LLCIHKETSLIGAELNSFGSYLIRCLEAFLKTEFNKIFSGRQPHQGVKILHFIDCIFSHLQDLMPCCSVSSIQLGLGFGVQANQVSGQNKGINELDLGCLLTVVEIVLVFLLSAAMFSIT
jgi:hypothetical protein